MDRWMMTPPIATKKYFLLQQPEAKFSNAAVKMVLSINPLQSHDILPFTPPPKIAGI